MKTELDTVILGVRPDFIVRSPWMRPAYLVRWPGRERVSVPEGTPGGAGAPSATKARSLVIFAVGGPSASALISPNVPRPPESRAARESCAAPESRAATRPRRRAGRSLLRGGFANRNRLRISY